MLLSCARCCGRPQSPAPIGEHLEKVVSSTKLKRHFVEVFRFPPCHGSSWRRLSFAGVCNMREVGVVEFDDP